MSFVPRGPHSLDAFLSMRPELPEAGQWAELDAGEVTLFEAPDTDHGLVVSHLTKRLASLSAFGTPVFRPVLRLPHDPATLRIPAVAYFSAPGRFDLIDADTVSEVPDWIIEIASTGDRRRAIPARASAYRQWGVKLLWIIDPRDRQLTIISGNDHAQYGEANEVSAEPVASLKFALSELFVEPEWWTQPRQ